MAKLTKQDVLHVAKLANLNLTPQETQKYLKQLSSVVDYVGQLSGVDTSNTEPTSQTTGLNNLTREDNTNPIQTLSAEKAVSSTTNVHNNLFVVEALLKEKRE